MRVQKINKNTYKKTSFENYQREILDIWPQLQFRPALHTWARVVQHATTACEGMRRSDWSLVLEEIATTIVWWMSFIQKLNLVGKRIWANDNFEDDFVFGLSLSATEMVWRKYPGVCPVEFGLVAQNVQNLTWVNRPAQVCTCLASKKEVEQRSLDDKMRAKEHVRQFARKNRRRCPKSIDALEDMFRTIFSGLIYHETIEEIFFHFIEEVGEVSEALANATTSECLIKRKFSEDKFIHERRQKLYAIAEELADVFSWSVSIVAKIQTELMSFEEYIESRHEDDELQTIRSVLKGSQHISLSEIIWQKYGLKYGELRCDDCDARPCVCIQQRAQPLYRYALEESRLRDRLKPLWRVTLD